MARAQDLPDAGAPAQEPRTGGAIEADAAAPPPDIFAPEKPAGDDSAPRPVDVTDLDLEALLETDVRALPVTAVSKKVERAGDAPATVTVLTHDDFLRHDWRNVAEALRSVPGFYVSYGRDYYYTGVRGLSFPTDVDTRILVLLDGHPLNNPQSARSNSSELFTVPPDAIERVEVIRGPSSSVYGTNAFFAVVNIVTRQPTERSSAHVSAQLGGETSGSVRAVAAGRRQAGDLQLSAYAVALGGPGPEVRFEDMTRPRLNSTEATPTDGVTRGTDYEVGYNLGGLARYKGLSIQWHWMERLKGLPTAPRDSIFNDPYNSVKDHHVFTELRWEQPLFGGTLELKGAYDRFRSRQYLRRDPTDWPADTWKTTDPHVVNQGDADSLTTGAQLSLQPLPSFSLVSGAEVAFHVVTQRTYELDLGSGDPFPGTVVGAEPGQNPLQPFFLLNSALYAQGEWRPSPSLGIVGGGRFDYNTFFSTADEGRGLFQMLAPRVAVVWSPQPMVTLKATYSEAFRTPSIYEARFDDRYSACGNAGALPERLRTAELGATLHLPSGLNASATAYLMGLTGVLVRVQQDSCYAGSGPRDRFINLGQGRVIGGEATLEYRGKGPTAFFSVSINHALAALALDGPTGPLPNSPLAVASAGLAVPFLQQRLWGSARAHFVSERLTWKLGAVDVVPPHVQFEVSVLATRLPGGLRVGVSLLNLLDDRWLDPVTSSETIPLAVPQDGLELRANVGLDW